MLVVSDCIATAWMRPGALQRRGAGNTPEGTVRRATRGEEEAPVAPAAPASLRNAPAVGSTNSGLPRPMGARSRSAGWHQTTSSRRGIHRRSYRSVLLFRHELHGLGDAGPARHPDRPGPEPRCGAARLMVAVPLLAGAALRVVNGIFVDRIGPLRTGMIGQVIVILGLLTAWWFGVHSFAQVLLLGVLLGLAGASFAVALPLASRWYSPGVAGPRLRHRRRRQLRRGLRRALRAGLAAAFGSTNVWASPPSRPGRPPSSPCPGHARRARRTPAKSLAEYAAVFRIGNTWWFMSCSAVTSASSPASPPHSTYFP